MAVKSDYKIDLLIVEDDAMQAQLLIDSFESFDKNINVKYFVSGEELFSFLSENKTRKKSCYLILDYFLQTEQNKEGVNGNEVITYLEEKFNYIKIILFSSYENDEDLKLVDLKNDHKNLLEVVKKSDFGFTMLKNIIRFDMVKVILNRKRKRFVLSRILFFAIALFSIMYFLI